MNDQQLNNSNQTPEVNVGSVKSYAGIDFKAAFGSKLFLALCIITTAFVILCNFNIIPILIAVGMWMCFAAGKSADVTMKPGGIKLVSGSLLAQFILNWFGILIIFAISALFIGIGSSASTLLNDPDKIFDTLYPIAESFDLVYELESFFDELTYMPEGALISIAVIYIAYGVICALIGIWEIILNFLYTKKLHSFTKSLAVCAEDPYAVPKNAKWCSIWMIIGGVWAALGALSMLGFMLMIVLVLIIICGIAAISGDSEVITGSIIACVLYLITVVLTYGTAVLMLSTNAAIYFMSFKFIHKYFVKPFNNA